MSKIDFLKEALTNKGFIYSNVGDYGITIEYNESKIIMWETIQDTIYIKVLDANNNKVFKKTYKSINNLIKYGIIKNKYIQ